MALYGGTAIVAAVALFARLRLPQIRNERSIVVAKGDNDLHLIRPIHAPENLARTHKLAKIDGLITDDAIEWGADPCSFER